MGAWPLDDGGMASRRRQAPRRADSRSLERVLVSGLLLAGGWLFASCGGGEADSRVVPLHARSLGPLPLEQGVTLFNVVDLEIQDSTLYVADAGLPGVQAIGLDGRRRWAVGRKGGGPLEFQRIVGISVLGDTIAVADTRNGRVTLIDQNGVLIADLDVGNPIGGFVLDGTGRLHLGRHRRIDTAGTVRVLRRVGDETQKVGSYGRYEARQHSISRAFHNEVALARGDHGDVWVLYRFRGLVLEIDHDLDVAEEWVVPLPKSFNPDSAYVREVEAPSGASGVALIRGPVATDIAMDDEGQVLVARSVAENETQTTQLLIYEQGGRLREVASLPVRAYKIAWSQGTLFTLEQPHGEAPTIGRYVLEPEDVHSR